MKRVLLACTAAAAWTLSACAHRPPAEDPRGSLPDLVGETDPATETEVREFLAAALDIERADAQADSLVGNTMGELSEALPMVDPAAFDFPVAYNERVQFWLNFFGERSRSRFATYLTRMGRYEGMIRSELRKRGMPEDLLYLALIESGFSPAATSHAAAVGLWQFIAPTGQRYGLEVSRYIDERRDPIKATGAALDYLQELYKRFGSWYLAAAAYNTGENRVERVLRERAEGARGDDALYWQISEYLHSDTRNYVPMILAASILAKYREDFGFADVVPQDPFPDFEVVTVPDATDIAVIARAAGVKTAEVEALNPHLLRGVTPPGRKVEVRIPAGRAEAFAVAYAEIPPARRISKVEHVVAKGETLTHIARRYNTTVAAIQEANGIKNANSVTIGRKLVISLGGAAPAAAEVASAAAAPARAEKGSTAAEAAPAAAPQSKASAQPAAKPGATTTARTRTYRVRAGDSLWGIAQRHEVSVDDLRKWNKLGKNSKIVPGQTLKIQGGEEVVIYRVQPGDTLWSIARRHGITADQLMQWNKMTDGTRIRPGDELEVPVAR
jgi:membrane-bound lytic murein transglycosylase D